MVFIRIISLSLAILLTAGCASQQSLHQAVLDQDDVKVQKLIYEKGASPYATNTKGQSAISLVMEQAENNEQNLPAWAKKLVDQSRVESSKTFKEIYNKEITPEEFGQRLKENIFDKNLPYTDFGNTLLYDLVARNISLEYINKLLNADADPDIPFILNWTPLMKAIEQRNNEIAEALITAGADVKVVTKDGWTPILLAVTRRYTGQDDQDIKLVKKLLKAGADINHRGKIGYTALEYSILDRRSKMQSLLLKENANPNTIFKHSWTPLMIAISRKDIELAEALISAGADVNLTHENIRTAITVAATYGVSELVETLITEGADINAVDKDGYTPLMLGVYWGNTQTVEALIAAGADVNSVSSRGWSALHFTANKKEIGDRTQDVELVNILLKAGANISFSKDDANTPSELALINNRSEVHAELQKNLK